MNLECSNEIKENIFNNEVLLVKIKDQIFCFSVSQIKELIDNKPFLIKQVGNEDAKMIFDDHPSNTVVKRTFNLRQSNPSQQILLLKDNIAVDYDFISAFQSGRNTFELSNPEVVWLFKDVKKYSIKTNLYKTKTIQRKNLLQNQEINEEIRSKLQDDYTRIKIQSEADVSIQKNQKPERKCSNDSFFDANDIVFDENLIMIYFEGKPSIVYCYSLNELVRLIIEPIDYKKKKELSNGVIIIKIDYTNVWVDINNLEFLIDEKVNTIVLSKREGIEGRNKIEYFVPMKSSRKELFPDNDFSSEISTEIKISKTEYHDDGEFRYRKRYAFYSDANGQIIPNRIYSIEWVRYKKIPDVNGNVITHRMSYKDEPAYVEFDRQGRKAEEEYVYENGIRHKISYENGEKKKERWFLNGKFHRNNNLPAFIEYTNGNVNTESYYENGVFQGRRFY